MRSAGTSAELPDFAATYWLYVKIPKPPYSRKSAMRFAWAIVLLPFRVIPKNIRLASGLRISYRIT